MTYILDQVAQPQSNRIGPPVFDAQSLALRLGIRRRTLWWLVLSNKGDPKGPKLYRHITIPKDNGGLRHLHEPCDPLKAVQKVLLLRFFAQYETTPAHVAAYVMGRSTLEAAQQHVGAAVKISVDIKNFFPSTTRKMVRAYLRREQFSEELVSILSNLLTVPLWTDLGVRSCLPQGSPTSAAVANRIAMDLIDAPLLAELPDDATYTRYCDNLEVSFKRDRSREEIDAYKVRIQEIVEAAGYRLNHKKTKIQRLTSPKIPMRVLGINTNTKTNIPSKKYRRLRLLIHQVKTRGLTDTYHTSNLVDRTLMMSPAHLKASLMGELQYWHRVNPAKMTTLIETLRQAEEATP